MTDEELGERLREAYHRNKNDRSPGGTPLAMPPWVDLSQTLQLLWVEVGKEAKTILNQAGESA